MHLRTSWLTGSNTLESAFEHIVGFLECHSEPRRAVRGYKRGLLKFTRRSRPFGEGAPPGGWPTFEAQDPHSTRGQFPPQPKNAGCRVLAVLARVRVFLALRLTTDGSPKLPGMIRSS